MPGIKDELASLMAGAITAALTKAVAKRYADPNTDLNMPSLKGFGKPSVYSHVGLGAAATGYVVDRAQKRGGLDDDEFFYAGFGIMALVDGLATGIADSLETATPAPATGMKVGGGAIRIVPQPGGTFGPQTRVSGYPAAQDGGLRGMI